MSDAPVDVAAIRDAAKAPAVDWDDHEPLLIRKGEWSDLWNAWQAAEARAADAVALLERAQAASEGVDMLVAQAERRGAVKALRQTADAVNCFDDSALATEWAEMIEGGEDPFWTQPNTQGHQSPMCVDGDVPGVDCNCEEIK